MEKYDNVIELPSRNVVNINGVALELGRMSLEELILLEDQCTDRYGRAIAELKIVTMAVEARFPGGGSAS